MANLTVTTEAVVPAGTSIDLTVYEDSTGDGSANNSDSVVGVSDGVNTYTLSGFNGTAKNQFWLKADLATNDETVTPELKRVKVSVNNTGDAALQAQDATMSASGVVASTQNRTATGSLQAQPATVAAAGYVGTISTTTLPGDQTWRALYRSRTWKG